MYVHGIVCSLKESFGFIERADIVNEVCVLYLCLCIVFQDLSGIFAAVNLDLTVHLPHYFAIFLCYCRYSSTTVSFKVILVIFYLVMMYSLLFMNAMYVLNLDCIM